MGILGDIGHLIMTPLYYIISAILLGFHRFFVYCGLDPEGGLSWALSIVGLTLVIRAALVPLFVRQIKSSRNMQLIQPKVKELQKKYGHDRQRLAEEQMKLYKETGTNPFSACLPLLLQMPIFFALFRLLDQAAKHGTAHGLLDSTRARQFGESHIFGEIPISATFWGSAPWSSTAPDVGVMVVALVLVLAMTATTFTTQRQLMSKNMPPDAMTGPYAQQQKMLLYVLPVAFGLGGVAFPIGVLLYWTVSNLWTMCQQFYVIRNNPAPGTPAFQAKEERERAKAMKSGSASSSDEPTGTSGAPAVASADGVPPRGPRQQPRRQSREQRRRARPSPAAGTPAGGPPDDGAPPTSGQRPLQGGPKPSTKRSKQQNKGGKR